MNRAIDARLSKIERLICPEDENLFAHLSHDDLLRRLREVLKAAIVNQEFSGDEREAMRGRLLNLELAVWEHVYFERRQDIARAIAKAKSEGRAVGTRIVDPIATNEMPSKAWRTDWYSLARQWGLVDEAGNLGPRPPRPDRQGRPHTLKQSSFTRRAIPLLRAAFKRSLTR